MGFEPSGNEDDDIISGGVSENCSEGTGVRESEMPELWLEVVCAGRVVFRFGASFLTCRSVKGILRAGQLNSKEPLDGIP
jgi:hypothetical protein